MICDTSRARIGPRDDKYGSRGRGYPKISTMTLAEALNDGGYLTVAQGIRDRLVELVRDYIDLGIIEASELL